MFIAFEYSKMKTIGKPCEGEPHARFDVAGDGIVNNAPSLDPTQTCPDSGKWMTYNIFRKFN